MMMPTPRTKDTARGSILIENYGRCIRRVLIGLDIALPVAPVVYAVVILECYY